MDFTGITVNECCTQRQGGEVDGVAVGAVASLISSSDLEGVDGARNQRVDGHRVGLTVHTHCTVHIWTLMDAEEGRFVVTLVICQFGMCVCVCVFETIHCLLPCKKQTKCVNVRMTIHRVYLVIVSKLVFQDVSIGPVRLRPWESDGVWGSAQLVHHGNCTGNCGNSNERSIQNPT